MIMIAYRCNNFTRLECKFIHQFGGDVMA